MDDRKRGRDVYTVTDAGQLSRKENVAQGPPPPIVIVPPEAETETKREIKIKKSTSDEYDKKTEKNIYVEPKDDYPDHLEYRRTGTEQGIVIIFNQVKFLYNSHPKRLGSTKDVNDIIFTLGRLGYNIYEKYIFSNNTSTEIKNTLNEIMQEDLTEFNSLIVFFLTHGEDEDSLRTADGELNTKDIWETLSKHIHLLNKPKLFVFQACKGDQLSTPFEKQAKNEDRRISYISLSSYPLPSDILICYSSAEGMKSFRNLEKGSWLVQEICKNFLAYGRRDDVVTLLTRVAKCVSTYTFRNKKQMPVIVSTLSKKFYLTKSKDRRNNLAVHQIYSNIYKILDDLDLKIATLEKTT